MTTNVLMVYPEIPETFWSFKHSLAFIGKKATFPPLSLLTVAALLPSRYSVRIIDLNVERLKSKDIDAADLVFVSAMLVQRVSLERVIARCKERGKTVVAGGPYPTSSCESIEGVDYFVLGEAELTLPSFIADWESGRAKRIYASDQRADISLTPPPRYDLIDMRPYSSMLLQYSRGCPFNCEFCEIVELFGRVPRVKGALQFLAELESLYALGYRGDIFIVDDNFIGNKAQVKELLRILSVWQEDHGRPFSFFTEASIDLAKDEELLDLMVSAGFTMAFIGIETPVEASLELTGKRQNIGISLLDSVHRIQAKGIEVTGGFILGFDADPADIAERQIAFIRESGIATAMVGLLTALPGTRLFKRLLAEGRILGESSGENTHALELNFIPKIPAPELVASYEAVLKAIYEPGAYFERCLAFLRRLPRRGSASRGFGGARSALSDCRALILSLLRQGFSRHGERYFGFLGSVLIERARLFPKAVELSIKGYNLFKTTEGYLSEAQSWRAGQAQPLALETARINSLGRGPAPLGFRALFAQIVDLRRGLGELERARRPETQPEEGDPFAAELSPRRERLRPRPGDPSGGADEIGALVASPLL